MKFIPILFSTPMVQAILVGSKTQTRRTKGLEKLNNFYFQSLVQHATGKITFASLTSDQIVEPKCPYGQVGDILWVRETFKEAPKECTWKKYSYKADYNSHLAELGKWKPSLFMPKDACRLFLKITNVRVERLQDISEADAEKEGINIVDFNCYENYMVEKDWYYNAMNQKGFHMIQDPIGSFASLWAKINGEQSWNDNPFVWCIEFSRIEKPENFI